MSPPGMFYLLLRELLAFRDLPRHPEPNLVMDDLPRAEVFMHASGHDGVLASTYLFHAIQASRVIAQNDVVLDLGCGPATQLAQIASLNHHAKFIGLEASPAMLALAEGVLARRGIDNVTLRLGRMETLGEFADASIDVVTCSMGFHHLADMAALRITCAEIRRVLRPGGGLYVVDFGRLRREDSQRFMAYSYHGEQKEVFMEDYFNSLRAAFSLRELCEAAACIGPEINVKRTFPVPFLVALVSPDRHALDAGQRKIAGESLAALSSDQQTAFHDLARIFAHGGFPLAW